MNRVDRIFPDDRKEKMIDLFNLRQYVLSPDNTYKKLHPPGRKYEGVEVGMMT